MVQGEIGMQGQTVLGKNIEVDFREAILHHDIRISLNDKEIDENQMLILSSQPTWVVGIYYDGKWNKEVILRDGKYNEIKNTPYSVKLSGSIGLLIPDPATYNIYGNIPYEEKKQKLSDRKIPLLRFLPIGILLVLIIILLRKKPSVLKEE